MELVSVNYSFNNNDDQDQGGAIDERRQKEIGGLQERNQLSDLAQIILTCGGDLFLCICGKESPGFPPQMFLRIRWEGGERGKWGNYCATFGKVPPSVNLTRMGCRRLGLGNTRRVSGYLDLSSSSVSFQFQEIQKILQIPRTTQYFIRIQCTLCTTGLAVNLIIFPPFCRKRPKVD